MIDFQTFETIYISIYVIVIMLLLITYIFVVIKSYKYPEIPNFIREDINKNKPITIAICGTTGSGKTFFCKKLSEYYRIEKEPNMCSFYSSKKKKKTEDTMISYYDSIYTNGDTTYFKETPYEFSKNTRNLAQKMKQRFHIFDGNYVAYQKEVWNRADYILYIDTPWFIRVWNVISRETKNYYDNKLNEIGCQANIWRLFYLAFTMSEHSLIIHSLGIDYHKKNLDEGISSFLEKSRKNQLKAIKVRELKMKKGETPKENSIQPARVFYLFSHSYYERVVKDKENIVPIIDTKKLSIIKNEGKKEIMKICLNDKINIQNFIFEWAKQFTNMTILFVSLGSSSFADGRAHKILFEENTIYKSDYDIYIVYKGCSIENIQVSELSFEVEGKVYHIDIQGHRQDIFEKAIEEYDEIPILALFGAISNPEQLLIYKKESYEIYTKKTFDLKKLRTSFSMKITQTIGKKCYDSSKAWHKFFETEKQEDYLKGMKCFYFAWKLTLYAIQLAKYNQISDFEEPIELWKNLQNIPIEVLYSENGYEACWKCIDDIGFKKKFKEFQNLTK